MDDLEKAISYYEQALEVTKRTGDRRSEGNWLGKIGNTYHSLGNFTKAIKYLENALEVSKQIGDKQSEGVCCGNLGSAYSGLGDYGRAIKYYKRAFDIAKQIGDKREGFWLEQIEQVSKMSARTLPMATTKRKFYIVEQPQKSDLIFISHTEKDSKIALQIAKGLEEAGYATWYYERDSLPGVSYLIQDSIAIMESQAVILIISPVAMNSDQITKDFVRAHEAGKPFIPVMCGITYAEFQRSRPEWRELMGTTTSISILSEGTVAVLPNIIAGLAELGLKKQLPDRRKVDIGRLLCEKYELKDALVVNDPNDLEGENLVPSWPEPAPNIYFRKLE